MSESGYPGLKDEEDKYRKGLIQDNHRLKNKQNEYKQSI
ncbi:hypothetical protein BMF77_02709 [Dolichospermum sp. UHCC 0315A]|nr:hypothetical protein BMF77_02709 [Dolichospermum sp. UHCC 0315A]